MLWTRVIMERSGRFRIRFGGRSVGIFGGLAGGRGSDKIKRDIKFQDFGLIHLSSWQKDIERQENWQRSILKRKMKQFCLGHVKFEIFIRHPRRTMQMVCCGGLEIWGERSAQEI